MNCQQWKVCDTKLWGVDHHYDRSLFQTGYAWFNIIPIMVMIMCYHLGGRVFPALSTINYHPTHGARKWPSVSKMNICLDISAIAISALYMYKWLAGYILQCHLCKSKTIHAQATTNHRSPPILQLGHRNLTPQSTENDKAILHLYCSCATRHYFISK